MSKELTFDLTNAFASIPKDANVISAVLRVGLMEDLISERKIEMDELKACPFCGSEAEIYLLNDNIGACCSNQACNLHRPFFETKTWNTRPIEDKLSKQLEIAVEALEHYAGLTGA